MTDPQPVVHALKIYTPGYQWSGQLTLTLRRRLSDIFNNERDDDFIEFEHMALSSWDKDPGQTLLTLDRVAISRSNTIVILCAESTAPVREAFPDRVVKVVQRVRIVVPPFILTGDFHATREVDWYNVFRLSKQRFLGLTAVDLASLSSDLALEGQVEFALINRQRIVAIELTG